jgi:hypothetical protein
MLVSAQCADASGAAAAFVTVDAGRTAMATASAGASVARWNATAYEIGFAEDSFRTFKAHRAFAMMHLAMHDAVNAVLARYRQHTFRGRDPRADPLAAAAKAAHDVLLALYPGASARLASELKETLREARDEHARDRGIALGHRAAQAQLHARRDDGWDAAGTFEFDARPGSYRTTPPWNGFVLQPGFRSARGFGISAPDQFRPSGPPSLASAAYATALDEVKRTGTAESTARTDEQAGYAIWWMEFAEGSVNRLARHLTEERALSLPDAARLFALLNMNLYDTYIAVWDSKYEFAHWRPYSAIREAGSDGNDATEPEPGWESLRPAPPFPEYVSAHAAACAATFAILGRMLGDQGRFSFATLTTPEGMPTRSFASFDEAAAECADSRIRLGWHFRYSTDAGLELGRAVAAWISERYLVEQPGTRGRGQTPR